MYLQQSKGLLNTIQLDMGDVGQRVVPVVPVIVDPDAFMTKAVITGVARPHLVIVFLSALAAFPRGIDHDLLFFQVAAVVEVAGKATNMGR